MTKLRITSSYFRGFRLFVRKRQGSAAPSPLRAPGHSRASGFIEPGFVAFAPARAERSRSLQSCQARRVRRPGGERPLLALCREAVETLAKSQSPSGGRVHYRGIHSTGRLTKIFRRAAAWCVRKRQVALRGKSRNRIWLQDARLSLQEFQPLIRKKPVFVDPPRERNVTFLKPKLVAQITFSKFGMRICFDGHGNPYSVRKARVA